jgi:hypothetical protein
MPNLKELPRYQCHKEVRALKIAAITPEELPKFTGSICRGSIMLGSACGFCERCKHERKYGPKLGAVITPANQAYAPFEVSGDYMHKHKPVVGGYFVIYEDGYQSFSPAKAFEDGYSLMDLRGVDTKMVEGVKGSNLQ